MLARWESVTHGNEGMRVKTLSLFGQAVPRDGPTFYFLCLGVLILTIVGTLNLLRSPTGRAFVAIRDSETAARSMGVNVSLYKVKSFAISAGDHRTWPACCSRTSYPSSLRKCSRCSSRSSSSS